MPIAVIGVPASPQVTEGQYTPGHLAFAGDSGSHASGWMGHASIENRTPFAFEGLHLADEEGRPLLVTVVRATYEIVGRQLVLAEKQAPVMLAGELHGDSPDTSSWRYEPEAAFFKPSTDVVLIGHAYAPRGGVVEVPVGFQVGPVSRSALVFGDRFWVRSAGATVMTRPQPFEKIPLLWERVFGGWDRTTERPELEHRNPVGMGFRARSGVFEDGHRLPNVEDPATPITGYGQIVPPAGFGFTSPNWAPRAGYAGTYDEAWKKERMPLLARDFDRRFFNAGAPGLIAPTYLRGDEQVAVVGASPVGSLAFRLPAVGRPVCTVSLQRRADVRVEAQLDTVVVNTDEDRVYLTWRGHVVLRDGPHDVKAIAVDMATARAPREARAAAPR
jgi:hypothetical protein